MGRDEQEERETFEEIDQPQQLAIGLLLDCAPPKQDIAARSVREWINKQRTTSQSFAIPAAAIDVLAVTPLLVEKLKNKDDWTDCGRNADIFYGAALKIANFCTGNDLIKTYAAFDFLFVRLFGGAIRPINPSLFVASLYHPSIDLDAFDSNEVLIARHARQEGWGTSEPVWFPNRAEPST